jgi:hypothetical protein
MIPDERLGLSGLCQQIGGKQIGAIWGPSVWKMLIFQTVKHIHKIHHWHALTCTDQIKIILLKKMANGSYQIHLRAGNAQHQYLKKSQSLPLPMKKAAQHCSIPSIPGLTHGETPRSGTTAIRANGWENSQRPRSWTRFQTGDGKFRLAEYLQLGWKMQGERGRRYEEIDILYKDPSNFMSISWVDSSNMFQLAGSSVFGFFGWWRFTCKRWKGNHSAIPYPHFS